MLQCNKVVSNAVVVEEKKVTSSVKGLVVIRAVLCTELVGDRRKCARPVKNKSSAVELLRLMQFCAF